MDEQRQFVHENDTVRILYNFNGLNAPVKISIQNKLDRPLYIDWKRSALIINDKAISYKPGKATLSGSVSASSWQWSNTSSITGGFSGDISLPEQLDFIPPQSYITKRPMAVTNRFFTNLPDSVYQTIAIVVADGSVSRVKRALFEEAGSPLRFRSYLTFLDGESPDRQVVYQHSFYIAEIVNTGLHPNNFRNIYYKDGNRFYVKKATGFGQGFGVVAGIAVLGATAALADNTAKGNNSGN